MIKVSPIRIAVVVPITGLSAEKIEARRLHLEKACPGNVKVDFLQVEHGPLSVESYMEHEMAAISLVEKAKQAAAQGYQAIIPWCTGGPGVIAAREALDIPIVHPLQAACQLASAVGNRFGLITPLAKGIRLVRQVIWNLKFNNHLAGIASPDTSVLELNQDPDRLVDKLCGVASELVCKHEADAIVLHCMGFCGLAEPLMKRLSIPVIDPGWAALHQAITLVEMGLCPSKLAYPYPKLTQTNPT